jgi:Predicted nucleic acid-binding protein, contains PIN domain
MAKTLIDAGPLVAYYSVRDDWHSEVSSFLEGFRGQFITTVACITEAMALLDANPLVQNQLITDLARGLYEVEHLLRQDFARIAELNIRYRNDPADFADLSLIVVSERLSISDIFTLDSDFSIYRRLGNRTFKQVFRGL